MLEGGYRIHGKIVSAFSRSVATHVSALHEPNEEVWDEVEASVARAEERRKRDAKSLERERKIASKAARLAAEVEMLNAPSPLQAEAEPEAEAEAGPSTAADIDTPSAALDTIDASVVPAEAEIPPVEEELGGRKRRRTAKPVDYQQLDLELRAEQDQAMSAKQADETQSTADPGSSA